MKFLFLSLAVLLAGSLASFAQNPQEAPAAPTKDEQAVLDLSKAKWAWMADKDLAKLDQLFEEKAMFVHMGGTWGKANELEVIKSGRIWYKQAEVYSAVVNCFGNTAILLTEIDLVAVVGGNEVVNPFMVTEVYIKENATWKMGSLSFSHLRRPVRLKVDPKVEPQR
ncbi:MAG TPA: nuclear transport factor 2 family protein [Sphingomicrobium sp.]|nr:nuclear transport factor 2 family protein [Sphingomicrobium sp.]